MLGIPRNCRGSFTDLDEQHESVGYILPYICHLDLPLIPQKSLAEHVVKFRRNMLPFLEREMKL